MTFRVLMDTTDITGTQTLTSTGDWAGYTTKNITVNLTAGNNRVLRLQFESGSFNLDSLQFTANTCTPPVITQNPVGVQRNVGQGHVITLTGAASGATSYRWFRNGIAVNDTDRISGATTNSVTLTTLEEGLHGGTWTLRATNACGSATSSGAVVRIMCGGNPGLMIEDVYRALLGSGTYEYCYWKQDLEPNFNTRDLRPPPDSNWGGGGSYNRAVVAGAVAYIRGTDPATWTTWWRSYLRNELGEIATVKWYYGGQELGSFSYQYLNVASVLAVHYKAMQSGDSVTADLARRWLRATFALQAAAAGGPLGPITQFAQETSRPAPQVAYQGPYIAMAGMRSYYIHWVDADRNLLLASAIGYGHNDRGWNPSVRSIRSHVNATPGVYGVTSSEATELRALVDNSTVPANFLSRFIPTTLRTQVPYHIFGWNRIKATLMAENTHTTNPPTYGVVYDPATGKADYLYPWAGVFTSNIQSGISHGMGWIGSGKILAWNDGAANPPHPPITDEAVIPTTGRSFWIRLAPDAPPSLQ